MLSSEEIILLIITPESYPALATICFSGAFIALKIISAPILSSSVKYKSLTFCEALINAAPPPITIPSATAAFTAPKASSILSFSLSFQSR